MDSMARAKVIVRKGRTVVHAIDTSIDEISVDDLITSLKQRYGDGYVIDREQVDLARAAASATQS